MILRTRSLTVLCAFAASLALPAQTAQPPASEKPLVYDVVSIHENKTRPMHSSVMAGNGTFKAENITVMGLVASLYGLRPDEISGLPEWANDRWFNVQAKCTDFDPAIFKRMTQQQRREMLLPALRERLNLKAHIETREMRVYELVPAKSGVKLHALVARPGETLPKSYSTRGADSMDMTAVPMSFLISALSNMLDANVIDKTGLTGQYTFKMTYSANTEPDVPGTDGAPSLFTALQEQLGLRLQSTRGPVDTLVVDHIDPPTSNDD